MALTRSIQGAHKQLLKQQLGFAGYRIGELYPRRTRRATAVNWLLAHLTERGEALPATGPLPPLLAPPLDPRFGHQGDPRWAEGTGLLALDGDRGPKRCVFKEPAGMGAGDAHAAMAAGHTEALTRLLLPRGAVEADVAIFANAERPGNAW